MTQTSKRAALKQVIKTLSKLIPLLGSDKTGEVLNAAEAIKRKLSSVGLDFHDLVTLLSAEGEPLVDLLTKLFEKPEDTLIRLGRERASFFHSAEHVPFADIVIDGHRVTWPLRGEEFSEWLVQQYFIEMHKAPSAAALKAAIRTLSAHARFDGERHAVYLRVAEVDNFIVVDLGNEQGQAVEINQNGWQIVDRPRARFRRAPGMAAMPVPQRGGKIDDLRAFINLSADDFILFVATILDAFLPARPHPVLYISGEEGSGKSAAARIGRELTDPSDMPIGSLPETVRDLFVAAHNAHSMGFDNVSAITPKISDALCQISSGSGFGKRKLYTDEGEFKVVGSRFIILNGIANAISRPDLADRAVVLPASPIRPEQRRSDAAFWRAFEAARPRILGALFDAVAHGLRQMPFVELRQKPRMADFAMLGCAVEGAFVAAGDFMRAFSARAAESVDVVVEEDCVATAIAALMMARDVWEGTAAQLLAELTNRDDTEARVAEQKDWPRDPTRLSQRLRRLAATLRKAGVEITFGRAENRSRTRMIKLRAIQPVDTDSKARGRRRPQPATADVGGRSDAADAIYTAGQVVVLPKGG